MVTYYKSYRYIDGKARWVITDDNDNIIDKSPTKGQLKLAIYDNSRNKKSYIGYKCCKCGRIETYIKDDGTPVWSECTCGRPECTGVLCAWCNWKEDNKKYKPGACRSGDLDRYSPQGKGFIGAQIVAITLGLDDCNIIMDNFCFYVDLSRHSKYGYVEVKTSTFLVERKYWKCANVNALKFDTLIFVCMDQYEPWKNVLRIYAIPSNVLMNQGTVSIGANGSKWDKFIIDEKQFNSTYHKMDIKKCRVLKKDEK